MATYFEAECQELAALFNALPSTLPEHLPSSRLPPQLDIVLLQEEGVWVAFNRAMHAAFGDGPA
ncbi:hypothetical protein M422DRAFT_32012 [Sphaerobolus stellatus SS14]|uniref:Uncharacterized protein n=1 Tax=Sphaerobolus stellatus (strain SS14) TaxID=990650 RepID=A0A0C9VHN7_SPHS4|nr:hypothetical protein M422DRAFT_32012 [Sphaerobolus stellatus SS14]